MIDRAMSLRPLYAPNNIVVIGASNDRRKFGGRPIHYMQRDGYQGVIYPVNPRETEIQGLKAYADVRDIEAEIDLALIAVPAARVTEAAQACAEAGVKSAVVIASGFAEADLEGGTESQRRLTEIANETGMRILGPNCLGTVSLHNGAVTTFASFFDLDMPKPGGIAIASQSGAIGGHILVLAGQRGIGVHSMMTTGNECDVDVAECIAYAATDPSVSVITTYFEGCRKPDVLRAALEQARLNRKPVIAMKVGATDIGAAAVSTHTAALAGSDAVFDAVLRSHGAYRARSIGEMLELAAACAAGKYPAGKRLAIVTISGGGGIIAADAAVEHGLDVPAMPAEAQRILKDLMPFAAVRNPVDTTAQVANNAELLRRNLEVVLDQGGCDAVVLFMTYAGAIKSYWENLKVMLPAFRARYPGALVVCAGLFQRDDAALLRDHGYMVVEDLNEAVAIVAQLEKFAAAFACTPNDATAGAGKVSVPTRPLNEYDASRLLDAAGVPMISAHVAGSADEAVAAAERVGWPVVLKLLSPDVAHKTEIGGVRLGLESVDVVRSAYDDIVAAARDKAHQATVDGVLVAPMATDGVETILGVVMDAVFGPVIMFGLGGIITELFEDVTFRPAPFDIDEAYRMINEIKGVALLQGARGKPPADIDALAKAISNLSAFAHANRDRLAGVDINPFLVRTRGEGVVGLDALIETIGMDKAAKIIPPE